MPEGGAKLGRGWYGSFWGHFLHFTHRPKWVKLAKKFQTGQRNSKNGWKWPKIQPLAMISTTLNGCCSTSRMWLTSFSCEWADGWPMAGLRRAPPQGFLKLFDRVFFLEQSGISSKHFWHNSRNSPIAWNAASTLQILCQFIFCQRIFNIAKILKALPQFQKKPVLWSFIWDDVNL